MLKYKRILLKLKGEIAIVSGGTGNPLIWKALKFHIISPKYSGFLMTANSIIAAIAKNPDVQCG